jgi:hypothetical protein
MKTLIFSLILGASLLAQSIFFNTNYTVSGGTPTSWVTGETLTTTTNAFTGGLGGEFTIGGSDVVVKSLGRWVVSGNSGTHTVCICDSTGDQATLASVSVSMSGATAGTFKQANLGTPIVLTAGHAYWLMSDEVTGGDQWYGNIDVTTTAVASVNTGGFAVGGQTCESHSGPWISAYGTSQIYIPLTFGY